MWNNSSMPLKLYQFSQADHNPISELLRDSAFAHPGKDPTFPASEATKTSNSKHIQFNPIIAEATHDELVANANIPYNEVLSYVELYHKLSVKYTALLEQHSTILQSKSSPETGSSSLPPSSGPIHPSLLYVPKTFTVPLTPNDPDGEKFKKTHFWTLKIYTAYETARKAAPTRINEEKGKSGPTRLAEDDENTNSHYVVFQGGARVPGSRISAIRATIRACLNDFSQHTPPPETWSQATISLQDFLHYVCSDRFKELTICEGNWKLDQMIQRIYWDWLTGWKKNNGHCPGVSKKRKAKNLLAVASTTKKPRSSSPLPESTNLSANAKGKQKARSRSQSPASCSLPQTDPYSTDFGPSSSSSDSNPLSFGSSSSSYGSSAASSPITPDSSLTTSDSSPAIPGSLGALPSSAGSIFSGATSGSSSGPSASGSSAATSGSSGGPSASGSSAATSGASAAMSGSSAATSGPSAVTGPNTPLDPDISSTVNALLTLSGNLPAVGISSVSSQSTVTAPASTNRTSVKDPLAARFGRPSGPTARISGVEEFARQDQEKSKKQVTEVKTIPAGDKTAAKVVYKKATKSTTAKNLYFIDYIKKVPKITSADFDILYKALKPEDIEASL